MKVFQINLCDKGSTGKIALDLLECKNNFDNDKLFVGQKFTNKKYVVQIQSKIGKLIHRFFYGILSLDFGSYKSTKSLIRYIKKEKPDIIHLHNLHGYYINIKILFNYLRKADIKVIWTLHDCWPFTGHCAHFDYIQCTKWQKECNNCKNLKQYPKSIFFDNSKKMFKEKKKLYANMPNLYLVTPSFWLKSVVKKSFFNKFSVEVINNGINLSNFHFTENKHFQDLTKDGKKVLLGVATPFSVKKGFYDFIKLSELLPDEYKIVLVGLNKRQIHDLPINIIGFEQTNSQGELAELYSLAYVFINFTYEDNFPTVNIEASACGVPIICYKTGGATEMLMDKNSIILEKGDYQGVISQLSRIEKLKQNKMEYISFINKKFSREKMYDQYYNLYKKILTKGKD